MTDARVGQKSWRGPRHCRSNNLHSFLFFWFEVFPSALKGSDTVTISSALSDSEITSPLIDLAIRSLSFSVERKMIALTIYCYLQKCDCFGINFI